jgi:predicted nucleotidyltransferase
MDEKSFSELVDRLEGLEWCIFSGVAVRIYTGSDREFGDIDFLVPEEDMEEFADRVDADVKDRDIVKDGKRVNDTALETVYNGIEIEATTGFPPERVEDGSIRKLFEKSEEREFMGRSVRVAPLEETMVVKARMDRPKDHRDIRLMNDLEFDSEFLLELVDDWGLDREEIVSILKENGISL